MTAFEVTEKGLDIKVDDVPPNMCSMVDLGDGWKDVKKLSICLDPETKTLSVKPIGP